MTELTRTTRELVLIHDLLLRDFVSLQDIQRTLKQLADLVHEDVEQMGDKAAEKGYELGLFLPYIPREKLHCQIGPYSQAQKLYRVLADHLYGVYSLGSIYTLQAAKFKRAGPFLLLSIDTRWKIGHW
jgi:hypothetical protein